jgi:hypothetical protein
MYFTVETFKTCYSWNKAHPCHGTFMMQVQMKPVWRMFWSTVVVVKISRHRRWSRSPHWSPIPWLPSSKNLVGFCWNHCAVGGMVTGVSHCPCAPASTVAGPVWTDSALGTLEMDCVALFLLFYCARCCTARDRHFVSLTKPDDHLCHAVLANRTNKGFHLNIAISYSIPSKSGSVALTTWHPLPLKLELTSPTRGSRSVGKARSRTQATEFSLAKSTGSLWCRQSQQSFNTLTPFYFLCHSLHVSAPTGHPQVRYTRTIRYF